MMQREGTVNPESEVTSTVPIVEQGKVVVGHHSFIEHKEKIPHGFRPKSAQKIAQAVQKSRGSMLPIKVIENFDLGVRAAIKGEMRQSSISFDGGTKNVRIITCPLEYGDVVESKDGQKFRIIVVPDNSNEPMKSPSGLVSPEGKSL